MAGQLPSTPTPAQIKVHQIKLRAAPLLDGGQFDLAIALLEEVLPLDRRDGIVHKMLGFAYSNVQNTTKAGIHLRRAVELGVTDAETMTCLAGILRDTGDTRGSLRLIDKVLDSSPGETRALNFKARMLRSMGDAEAALDLLNRARDAGVWHAELAIMRAEIHRKFKRLEDGLGIIDELLADPRCPDHNRRDALYERGHTLDAMKDYDAAFDAFSRANAMLPEPKGVIPIDEFREIWSAEAITQIPAVGDASDRPVFVVGMPRSGTTLTEQILASHPRIGTVGESNALTLMLHDKLPTHLDADFLKKVAGVYLEKTAPSRAGKFARIVDKMPENYYYVAVISRSLPNASIIHCVRDARDTCLSCFFQNFGTRLGWTARLESCAKQYAFYRQIMDHWRQTVDKPILDSCYERLTSDPRPNVENLLSHVGMPFDEACMAHHKQKANVQTASVDQVRKPIYTSSQERWKRYEKHLGPMLEILEGY
ncbi:MAG: sulfotransferase [Phycisphaeraceae bacterium]|nr:MAG: sulfotransferase [Phycisphaeraceae bacterium]